MIDGLQNPGKAWGVPANQRKSANRPVVAALGSWCQVVEEATLGFPDVAPQSHLHQMGSRWNINFSSY